MLEISTSLTFILHAKFLCNIPMRPAPCYSSHLPINIWFAIMGTFGKMINTESIKCLVTFDIYNSLLVISRVSFAR